MIYESGDSGKNKEPEGFGARLARLRDMGLLREVHDRETPAGVRLRIRGRECVNFASNDYLGLAAHPRVRDIAAEIARLWGAGSGASRLLGGGTTLHGSLEERLAALKSADAALLFNTGYAANTGAIPALALTGSQPGSIILSDERNHASIIDGCRLARASGAEVSVYRHLDMDHLKDLLSDAAGWHKMIVTDSVFSMEGDLAPLGDLIELAEEHDALLYIDDAHATGVMGGGAGALAHLGLEPTERVLQMGTLSKALGSAGGFVAGSGELIQWLVNRARSFIYTTAMPPSVAGAGLAALGILESEEGKERIDRLWRLRERLAGGLEEAGFQTGNSATPIIPVMCESVADAARIAEGLFERGYYAPAIRPPTVPEPLIRLSLSAEHVDSDIDGLIRAIAEAFGKA